jgi:hypothetical protein
VDDDTDDAKDEEAEELKVEAEDITGSAGITSVDDLVELALGEAGRPFQLEGDLLIRARLFRRSADESLLVLTLHHIIADKKSLQIIAEELSEIYEARQTGRAPQLKTLRCQYSDYSRWQRGLSKNELEPLLFYWRWQLRGRLQALELPEDRPRAAVHTYTAGRLTFGLDTALATRMEALGGLVTLAWLGPQGLRELGETCLSLVGYARERIDLPAAFDRPAFKELAVRTPIPAREVIRADRERGVHPGYALGRDVEGLDDVLLIALTEKRTPAEIDRLADVLAEVCG